MGRAMEPEERVELEPFVHRLRVRYGETDRMGVAHHSSYVAWFEETRTEWMRASGLSYRAMEDGGLRLPVVRVDIEYHRPVTYEDEVLIDTAVVAGADIQDAKGLGTCHLAPGRDDHLGGDIVPEMFKKHENSTHDDILFAPH
ncbi:MAG: acyl-CoA thioesterase, partial [Planctomycetota bacterium]